MSTPNNKSTCVVMGLCLYFAPSTTLLADTTASPGQAAAPAASNGDNSGRNQRDVRPDEPTAQDQKNEKGDVERTRVIRRAIIDDKSLSTYAHNIKIVTTGNDVVLKGPVRSAKEKAELENIAAKYAGTAHVRSEIEVTP